MCSIHIHICTPHGRQSLRNRAKEEMRHSLTHTVARPSHREEERKMCIKCSLRSVCSCRRCCCCCRCSLLLFLFVDDSQHVPRLFVDLYFSSHAVLFSMKLFFFTSSHELFAFHHFWKRLKKNSRNSSTHLSSITRKIASNVKRCAPFHTVNNTTNSFIFLHFIFSPLFFKVNKSLFQLYLLTKWR